MTAGVAPATSDDLAAVGRLLAGAGLPPLDGGGRPEVLVASDPDGTVVGCVAVEGHGRQALLRSLAVEPAARGAGAGRALVAAALDLARAAGAGEVVLLTNEAAGFFARLGFSPVDRAAIAGPVAAAPQFVSGCEGAVVMRRAVAP